MHPPTPTSKVEDWFKSFTFPPDCLEEEEQEQNDEKHQESNDSSNDSS